MISWASSLPATKSLNAGSCSIALVSVIPTSKGISFDNLSAKPKALPCTRATSRTTALAAMVPKVII